MKLFGLKNRKCPGCFMAAKNTFETGKPDCHMADPKKCYVAGEITTVQDKDGNSYCILLFEDLTGKVMQKLSEIGGEAGGQ